jgi:hypothetical protein
MPAAGNELDVLDLLGLSPVARRRLVAALILADVFVLGWAIGRLGYRRQRSVPAAAGQAQPSRGWPRNRPRSSRYSSRPTPLGSRKYRLSSTPRSGPR